MTLKKHTPGPWGQSTIQGEEGTLRMIGGPALGVKGDVSDIVAEIRLNRSGAEANARLIAMAPEMLEALIETRDLMSRLGSPTMDGYAKVDAVITKATGQGEGR